MLAFRAVCRSSLVMTVRCPPIAVGAPVSRSFGRRLQGMATDSNYRGTTLRKVKAVEGSKMTL